MTGEHHVKIWDSTITYEFDLYRNVTMLRGNSGNGKTTLFDMVSEHYETKLRHAHTDVSISCDKQCATLPAANWQSVLRGIKDSIVFVDEYCIPCEDRIEFARAVKNSDNYYVIISRDDIKCLPYSITEIYTIRESKHYGGIQKAYSDVTMTYNRFSRVYDGNNAKVSEVQKGVVITEDSGSGHEMFTRALPSCLVDTAKGKSNIIKKSAEYKNAGVVAVVDGAAFGPEMQDMMRYIRTHGNTLLYAPESFEYLLLNLRIFRSIKDKLENTADYAESSKYLTWEQYYEDLLKQELNKLGIKYDKGKLPKQLLSDATVAEFREMLPDIFK